VVRAASFTPQLSRIFCQMPWSMRYWTAAWIAAVNCGSALAVTTPWGAASSPPPTPAPRPGTWISAAIVTVLGAMLIHGLVTNEKFHWSTVWFFLREVHVVKAVGWTLLLTFMAMAIGIVLAVTTAILRQSSNPVLRWVALAYLWFFRGTPIYTQLVFWGALSALYQKLSLGIPFGPELLTFKTTTVFTPFVAAVLGLGINEGAYLSEIVRSGLNSVDKGQSEAAGALGMSRGQILRRIVLPQAGRSDPG